MNIVKIIRKNDNFEEFVRMRVGDVYNFKRINAEEIEVINGYLDFIAIKQDARSYLYEGEYTSIVFKVIEEV